MQGTGTLTAFAGQTISLSGAGQLLLPNYEALLSGTGTLSVSAALIAGVTMSGTSELTATATSIQIGYALLPALTSIGSDAAAGYGYGAATLPALSSSGEGGFYIPPAPVIGYGNLQPLVSSGIVKKSAPGAGDSSLPALQSIGGEAGYGYGYGELMPLTSGGMFGFKNVANFFSGTVITSTGISNIKDVIIIFSSDGTLADTISGTKEYIQQIISEISGSSEFSLVGEFSAEVISAIISGDILLGQKTVGAIISPDLDSESRVWVVNMDNHAASQYESYGFSSFFNRDGKSYGIAQDGIYELNGNTDSGADIEALLEFGRSNHGSSKVKKVHHVYVGIGGENKFYIKADADGKTFVYESETYTTAMSNNRVDIGKGLFGNFWNFTMMNKDGASFVLSTVHFEPIELTRRMR